MAREQLLLSLEDTAKLLDISPQQLDFKMKNDPTFPYVNMGNGENRPYKKVPYNQLCVWIQHNTCHGYQTFFESIKKKNKESIL